jgi:hypothetical protein
LEDGCHGDVVVVGDGGGYEGLPVLDVLAPRGTFTFVLLPRAFASDVLNDVEKHKDYEHESDERQ